MDKVFKNFQGFPPTLALEVINEARMRVGIAGLRVVLPAAVVPSKLFLEYLLFSARLLHASRYVVLEDEDESPPSCTTVDILIHKGICHLPCGSFDCSYVLCPGYTICNLINDLLSNLEW